MQDDISHSISLDRNQVVTLTSHQEEGRKRKEQGAMESSHARTPAARGMTHAHIHDSFTHMYSHTGRTTSQRNACKQAHAGHQTISEVNIQHTMEDQNQQATTHNYSISVLYS